MKKRCSVVMVILLLQGLAQASVTESKTNFIDRLRTQGNTVKTHMKDYALAYGVGSLVVSIVASHLYNKGFFDHLWYAQGERYLSQKHLESLVVSYQKMQADYVATQAEYLLHGERCKQIESDISQLHQKNQAIITQEKVETISEKELLEYHETYPLLKNRLKKQNGARDACLSKLSTLHAKKENFINAIAYRYGQHNLHSIQKLAHLTL